MSSPEVSAKLEEALRIATSGAGDLEVVLAMGENEGHVEVLMKGADGRRAFCIVSVRLPPDALVERLTRALQS